MSSAVIPFEQLGINDIPSVGGKNASLGEMISHLSNLGVSVPGGYATTADAFRQFLATSRLDNKINAILDTLNIEDVHALAEAGAQIRDWVISTPLPSDLEQSIRESYNALGDNVAVAVRSSATAEDLPDASFAGQQETFLNVRGEDEVIARVKEVFASLFNDRAISYRVHQGFDHREVALSAGIQRMVRSETGASGVMFTLDTESGHRGVVFITASWGLGEMVVQGAVNPDEFYVHKETLNQGFPSVVRRTLGSKAEKMIYAPAGSDELVEVVPVSAEDQKRFCLSDAEIIELAKQAQIIEKHYGRPMDIEWGKDGDDGQIYILQARPETVRSRSEGKKIEQYQLNKRSEILVEGRAIGQKIGAGVVCNLDSLEDMDQVHDGAVLVTDMTDPDWEPIMKRCSAIVTNRGGRTCHAAIIARELGIPAVVGCDEATRVLTTGDPVTVSCSEGDTGFIYKDILPFEILTNEIGENAPLPLDILMNVANPDRALDFAQYPNQGVGLARLEFIINRMIGVHPKALLNYNDQDEETKAQIDEITSGYPSPVDFYVEKIVEGVATIAAAFHPKKAIVRLSDFKSNEYANLIGGRQYEPEEENPMIGFRGASRYISDSFRDCFILECLAMKRVREELGLTNVELMVPFVRTLDEARQVTELLAEQGLKRGENGLRIIMMCELPSNALLAEQFLEYFDGFSIGSNDLTQLTLGLDRDSGLIAHLFDERNAAVKSLLEMAISACKEADKYVGICGQGPSDHPDLADWLMQKGISSVSLTPDSVLDTWKYLSKNTS
ncbi:MAG: phosphoenolpyruvate synthase [Porticoccaceae bacterium]|nr:phosphoenolpyruvate synthase [Porticoccaceae bacterium]